MFSLRMNKSVSALVGGDAYFEFDLIDEIDVHGFDCYKIYPNQSEMTLASYNGYNLLRAPGLEGKIDIKYIANRIIRMGITNLTGLDQGPYRCVFYTRLQERLMKTIYLKVEEFRPVLDFFTSSSPAGSVPGPSQTSDGGPDEQPGSSNRDWRWPLIASVTALSGLLWLGVGAYYLYQKRNRKRNLHREQDDRLLNV